MGVKSKRVDRGMTKGSPRIVITGGSGFIGTNAVEYFLRSGYAVLSLDRMPPKFRQHSVHWRACDVCEGEALRPLIASFQPEYILHLAARTDLDGRDVDDYASNVLGVRNILHVAHEIRGVRRLIFASTRMVHPIGIVPISDDHYDPPNAYGASKAAAEDLVRRWGGFEEWVIVRPTGIWGPWFGVPYKTFFEVIARGLYFNPGRYDPAKSFGYVGNTVYQLRRLIEAPSERVNRKTLYLCDYDPVHVRAWAELIRSEFGQRKIWTMPSPFLRLAAAGGDLCKVLGWSDPPITTFRLSNLIADMVYETAELEEICGALPFTLEDAVRETVGWMSTGGKVLPGTERTCVRENGWTGHS